MRQTVTAVDDDALIHIWSAQARYIGQLRRHLSFTEIKSGRVDGTEFAVFTIPASEWSPATGAKRRSGMTADQWQAAADRLRALRGSLSPKIPDQASALRNELSDEPLPGPGRHAGSLA